MTREQEWLSTAEHPGERPQHPGEHPARAARSLPTPAREKQRGVYKSIGNAKTKNWDPLGTRSDPLCTCASDCIQNCCSTVPAQLQGGLQQWHMVLLQANHPKLLLTAKTLWSALARAARTKKPMRNLHISKYSSVVNAGS